MKEGPNITAIATLIGDPARANMLTALGQGRRPLCRARLDWSERRNHLGGALGAAILQRIFQLRWARRLEDSRAVFFARAGKARFNDWLKSAGRAHGSIAAPRQRTAGDARGPR